MSLIDAIRGPESNPTGGSATVAAINLDGTVDIEIAGSVVTAACLEGYADRAVGHVVFVVRVSGGYVVINRFSSSGP
ncbi:hypothetical protein ABZ714_30770 [Streptomyces sp. NPDC006798]|uniref:hypothetical protein n=1 Tax=unclassified Streptomyces TaxID=2593676 RepID=UPI00332018D7